MHLFLIEAYFGLCWGNEVSLVPMVVHGESVWTVLVLQVINWLSISLHCNINNHALLLLKFRERLWPQRV